MLDTHIGPYLIEKEIGSGSMAVVYKAYDAETQNPVALKVLHNQLAHDHVLTRRLQQEAKIVSGLRHPNIIKIYHCGQNDTMVYIAMEYMAGGSLDNHFRTPNAITLEATANVLRQIADGLDYAHQEGIVHRDLKMGNILLDEQGRMVISDF